jgi:glycosyltransferase involved in cell wall biosynthesis
VPPKIAFDVTPLLGPLTGVGVVTKGLFDVLIQRSDIEIVAFALSARGHRELPMVLPATMKRNRLPMPAAALSIAWERTAHPKLEPWVGKVDLVHGTNFVVPPAKSPCVVTVHDMTSMRFPEMCEPHTLRYPKLIKAAVSRGAHIHTFSQFVANEVQELLNVDGSRVHVIAPGLDDLQPVTNSSFSTPAERYVLAVGTAEPRKNFPALVRAFDRIAAAHPDTSLVISGGRGWEFDQFENALKAATHKTQIRYLGRASDDDRNALMTHATALAYTSIYEGYGMPPLEAMRAGVPVIAANVASIPEVAGDAALLVDPRDEKAIAAGLETLLTDDSRRTQLIDAGYKHIENLSWKHAGDQFVELYRELAQ